jgi:hypothetical protein
MAMKKAPLQIRERQLRNQIETIRKSAPEGNADPRIDAVLDLLEDMIRHTSYTADEFARKNRPPTVLR